MDARQTNLLKLLNSGEVEKILQEQDLNRLLNDLVEMNMIDINAEEITLTRAGLEVIEMHGGK